MTDNITTIDKLIQLSRIFKAGYTVEIKNDMILQYNDMYKPYIVSYKTIIEVANSTLYFHAIKNLQERLKNCIIGGWFDPGNSIFYIEFNRTFHNKRLALIFGKQQKQKSVYDLNKQETIKV